MAAITVSVDDEVYSRFRKQAAEEMDGKKGFLGDALSKAMGKYLQEKEQDGIARRYKRVKHICTAGHSCSCLRN